MAVTVRRGPDEVPIDALRKRTISIVGFGNQGQPQALNMRDSGLTVQVGARTGSQSGAKASALGFPVMDIKDAVANSDLIIMALPDEVHKEVFDEHVQPTLQDGATLGFLHGLSIRYKLVVPPPDVGVIMVAPKGPGVALRQRFEKGQGLPCLMAVEQENRSGDAKQIALAWAAGLGAARAAVIETTFAHEAETDLFGEQAVLCGGMLALLRAGFETLTEAGYPPELAYMECCQEIKQIADLVFERGMAEMLEAISNTAAVGVHVGCDAVDSSDLRQGMRRLLEDVQSGQFAKTMEDEHAKGHPVLQALRATVAASDLEQAGHEVRQWMPWLAPDQTQEP